MFSVQLSLSLPLSCPLSLSLWWWRVTLLLPIQRFEWFNAKNSSHTPSFLSLLTLFCIIKNRIGVYSARSVEKQFSVLIEQWIRMRAVRIADADCDVVDDASLTLASVMQKSHLQFGLMSECKWHCFNITGYGVSLGRAEREMFALLCKCWINTL